MRSAVRRVLGLVLVAVALMGIIGLAASETFINKTGKTVTGITVTFSKRVMITRHDSVFPDQSPNGRSQEFTFSGGNLRNLGRFGVTWSPSSGNVTDYEWIEKAQPVQQPQSTPANKEEEFKLPDPNTPPILYGNDYPGPDEPLYQPQDDEQIWLTDADGHGDIYDNDSIKINYAPRFDKSQITKIDVYRNGIKLRFLPETFDVLTNAQMKTFDGNPAEHSPASNHTDHAIMGYEYKFEIHTADHLWILTKTVKSGFRWQPRQVWAMLAISWHWGWIDSYPSAELLQFLTYLRDDGFTGISIEIPVYVLTPHDNDVFELFDRNSAVATLGGIVTPKPNELEKALKAAEEVGLEVNIRWHFYISQKYKDVHGFRYSDDIDPSDPQEFFDDYTRLVLKWVPLLNRYHVKLMTLFIEMNRIEKYPSLLKQMYTTISDAFDGELGFEEGTASILSGRSINDQPIRTVDAFGQIVGGFTFWDWKTPDGRRMINELDIWTPPLETQDDQRVSVMWKNFVKFLGIAVDYYRATYPGNQFMFGEIGAYNANGFVMGPDYYYSIPPNQLVMDEQEMADYILAALMGSEKLHIDLGLNLWGTFFIKDSELPAVPWPITVTGHYSTPASPIYRTFTTIIKPDE